MHAQVIYTYSIVHTTSLYSKWTFRILIRRMQSNERVAQTYLEQENIPRTEYLYACFP